MLVHYSADGPTNYNFSMRRRSSDGEEVNLVSPNEVRRGWDSNKSLIRNKKLENCSRFKEWNKKCTRLVCLFIQNTVILLQQSKVFYWWYNKKCWRILDILCRWTWTGQAGMNWPDQTAQAGWPRHIFSHKTCPTLDSKIKFRPSRLCYPPPLFSSL